MPDPVAEGFDAEAVSSSAARDYRRQLPCMKRVRYKLTARESAGPRDEIAHARDDCARSTCNSWRDERRHVGVHGARAVGVAAAEWRFQAGCCRIIRADHLQAIKDAALELTLE